MSVKTTYVVAGMTCDHCVQAVIAEVGQLPGVSEVSVNLHAGGDSQVTVTSGSSLPDAVVRAAVNEAGYTLRSGSA